MISDRESWNAMSRISLIMVVLSIGMVPPEAASQQAQTSSFIVDARGLIDRQTGVVVLDVKRPRDLDSKLGFTAAKEVTAWTTDGSGKKKPIGFKVEYRTAKGPAFTLSIDDHGGSLHSRLEVFDKNISDPDGISPGLVLSSHPTYKWDRRCKMKEGVYGCSSSSKNLVYFLADGASRFKSRKEAIESSPVKSIYVESF